MALHVCPQSERKGGHSCSKVRGCGRGKVRESVSGFCFPVNFVYLEGAGPFSWARMSGRVEFGLFRVREGDAELNACPSSVALILCSHPLLEITLLMRLAEKRSFFLEKKEA